MKNLKDFNSAKSEQIKGEKLTCKEFNDKLNDWYNRTRPASAKPRMHVVNSFYEMYLNGEDFKYLELNNNN